MIGRITNWMKTYGFIEAKFRDDLGWHVNRYFLPISRIMAQTVDVHVDCWVRFDVHRPRPHQPGMLPVVESAEVFETLAEKAEGSAA